MTDMGELRQRVLDAEKHLQASALDRNREAEELMQVWHHIRDRFTKQESAIAAYRSQVAELGKRNDELVAVIEELLRTVENNVAGADDDTIPRIATLVMEFLETETGAADAAGGGLPAGDAAPAGGPGIVDVAGAIKALDPDDPPQPGAVPEADEEYALVDAPIETGDLPPPEDESESSGIRDLMSRLGAAIDGSIRANTADATPPADPDLPADPESPMDLEVSVVAEPPAELDLPADAPPSVSTVDGQLADELKVIETLRGELNGLREKISSEDDG